MTQENFLLSSIPLNQLNSFIENSIRLALKDNSNTSKTESTELLNINEASSFLSLKKATLYSKVSKGEVPHHKRNGRLYFISSELIEYIKEGKISSNNKIDVDELLSNNKKGLSNE